MNACMHMFRMVNIYVLNWVGSDAIWTGLHIAQLKGDTIVEG